MRVAGLLLLTIPAVQDGSHLGPTPPPDHYDPGYDAALFHAWGGQVSFVGPMDKELPPQPRPLRPTEWIVLDGDASDLDVRSETLMEHVVRAPDRLPIEERGRTQTMPAQGELEGAFACALTRVVVHEDEIRLLRAPGAELVFVNGEGFVGDPDRRGWLGVPVALRAGQNEILVLGVQGGFEVELWKPVTRLVMASWAVAITSSDESGGWPQSFDALEVPIFNASLVPSKEFCFHYGRARTVGTLPGLGEWNDEGHGAPLAIIPSSSYLFDASDPLPSGPRILASLAAFDATDTHGERRLLPLRTDQPPPKWVRRVAPSWPPPGIQHQSARVTWGPSGDVALVIEPSGDPRLEEQLLAVARFCQQRLWECGGVLLPLLSKSYLDDLSERCRGFSPYHRIVRFGRLEADEAGVLWAGPEEQESESGPAVFAIRGSDPTGLRLAYVIEPFFREIGPDGKFWSVR